MIPLDALKFALAKEQNSVQVYNKLLAQYSELKDLFYFLLNEE